MPSLLLLPSKLHFPPLEKCLYRTFSAPFAGALSLGPSQCGAQCVSCRMFRCWAPAADRAEQCRGDMP